MLVDFEKLAGPKAYHWMTAIIAPRPIAWVSSMGPEGQVNLAPFSFFTGITSRPPTLMFVPINQHDGTPKDTMRNIEATGEFVVNVVTDDLAETMNATAAMLPYGESEFEAGGIEAAKCEQVKAPRVAAARIALECKLDRIVKIGDEPGVANCVFGRILWAHVSDEILNTEGRIDPTKLDLTGRMGGDDYVRAREKFSIGRPPR
ncbi:flavin reductase family protein [Actomonas aquatica]|uniref:Flavin reductase family protein n=1 Tax=Actomonas aquatica TaxID=2866162 RepID=A0ABZ1C7J9_9BACT|nr:flavin reductase family protein [Opitutus sp. WL0086]WRQ86280.1 flavin reductase family protein [Opitutus sp. WL0086]